MEGLTSLSPAPAVTLPIPPGLGLSPSASPEAVGRQFESIFTSMVVKQMRQTLDEDSMFGSDPGDVIGGMFDQFLGEHLAKSGSLGIAQMIRAQLERRGAQP